MELLDHPATNRYPMPCDYAGRDEVAVGRVRLGRAFNPGLTFWLVGDQLKKGAALNAVQIAEAL
jgi:aspartate-semialdehyde dehydrogenase